MSRSGERWSSRDALLVHERAVLTDQDRKYAASCLKWPRSGVATGRRCRGASSIGRVRQRVLAARAE